MELTTTTTTSSETTKPLSKANPAKTSITSSSTSTSSSLLSSSAFVVTESIRTENNGTLAFTLKNLNVSFVNALRRTILSDIKTVVFKTAPYEDNMCLIEVNTTRMNNEVLKNRLSAVPIFNMNHLTPELLSNLYMEVRLKNDSNVPLYLTTEHFQIRSIDESVPPNRDEVFPINAISNQYIDLMLLRPKIENQCDGDVVQFRCGFSIGCAKEDANFNVVSHCTYRLKLDDEKINSELELKKQQWEREGIEDTKQQIRNWMALEAQRLFIPNMFDFEVQTLGVYRNEEIILIACKTMIERLHNIMSSEDRFVLGTSKSTTMTNAFDILLKDEDYTIGKMVEYCFFNSLYENAKQLHYVGFVKMHPHDTDSLIRLAYKRPISLSDVKSDLFKCLNDCILVLEELKKGFE